MDKKPVPYRKTVFVCTHTREEGRVACGNPGRGGLELCESLKHAVKEADLKGKIRVARSGCLDLCEQGPNAFIYPGDEWLSGVTKADTPDIIKKLVD
ncbi:MAG: ferredoxin [Elusimicrobia bacterium CG11_big_fil_rev_8_21_14_0_20_64_6]|nr:MAG: ferredoxin [Elusimicrobia bacterium CG11_big_fil_rev_8_21_14_0_20_64_6]